MCGIAGIRDRTRNKALRGTLAAFTQALAHRGPDGEGFFVDERVGIGLGHRRLAILDLSPTGQQPLAYQSFASPLSLPSLAEGRGRTTASSASGSANGRYQVVFNGEIYNFLELRRELEGKGYKFQTQTDTEVIPAAYDCWGADCQLKFNGMWAFALWDAKERTLFLSRDRFGIKPLYYILDRDRFAFASELKAFLHLEGFSPEPSRRVLQRVLTNPFSVEGTEDCLLSGVKRLAAGSCLLLREDFQAQVTQWWRTWEHLPDVPERPTEQAERFRELFYDSCRLRLRSDVPVATCLSGGLDSSAVLCALAEINRHDAAAERERRAGQWQRAFVVSYPGSAIDERHYAEEAIAYAKAEPHILRLEGAPSPEELAKVVYDFEDITTTLPWPVWSLYRELRRNGAVVSLDGHGADEMLGGYPHYAASALQTCFGALLAPRRSLDVLRIRHGMILGNDEAGSMDLARLSLAHLSDLAIPSSLLRPSWRRGVRRWLKRHGIRFFSRWLTEPLVEEPCLDGAASGALDRRGALSTQLYADFHQTILPTILRNFDRCSMAHGVEVRMPFMDWRLVTYTLALPDTAKWGGGFTKRVLRDAMAGRMPERLRTRRSKIGFNSPLCDWFSGPLKVWLLDQVSTRSFCENGLWSGSKVKAFAESKARDGRWSWHEAEQVWLLVHANLWLRAFGRGSGARL